MKYDKRRGVKFGTYHSYRQLGAFLKTKKITPPEPQSVEIEIPGMDGKLDITETVYGSTVRYKNRILSAVLRYINTQSKWPTIFSDVMNKVHGKYMKIRFDDDKNYYYKGRVYVRDLDDQGACSDITIECDVEPYKYCDDSMMLDDWLWDELDFEVGVIVPHKWVINGSLSDVFINPYYETETFFTCISGNVDISFKNKDDKNVTYSLSSGEILEGDYIKTGETDFTMSGNGTVSLEYSERRSL